MNKLFMIKSRYSTLLLFFLLCSIVINANAQEKETIMVTGTVVDAASGEPVVGANISVRSFSSAFTGEDGSFSLQVPDLKVTLLTNAKGFEKKEVALRGRNTLSISVYEQGYNSLYGDVAMPIENQSHSSITGAVSSINGAIEGSSKTVARYISGKAAGLRTIMRSGTPSIGANMFLRGYNSLSTSSQPLVIVDGMILETNTFSHSLLKGFSYDPLSDINPKDIDNITVIKDASSEYGSKAANGVIIIETTSTDDVATKIDFFAQSGLNFTPEEIPMMNASQYKTYLVNQLNSSGMYTASEISKLPFLNENPAFLNYQKYKHNTDWQKEVFKNSYSQDYYLRITGGDEVAKYGLSIGLMDNSGVVNSTRSQRFSTRFNSESNITSKMKIKSNFNVGYQNNKLADDGLIESTSPIYVSLLKSPMLAPTAISADGILTNIYEGVDAITGYSNPAVLTNVIDNENTNYKLFGSFDVSYDFTDNFRLSSLIGANYVYNRDDVFYPQNGVSPSYNAYGDSLYRSGGTRTERFFAVFNDTRLSYKFQKDKNDVGLYLGARYNTNNYENAYSTGGNSGDDEFVALESMDRGTFITDGIIGEWKYASIYSKVKYGFNSKYYLNATLSYEGSSRFGYNENNQRFGLFPSVGAAWLVSSEQFMKAVNFIDLLKVRASYGITGNDQIGNYNARSYFISTRFLGGTGLVSGNLANTTMQWESTVKQNLGIDVGLFNERLWLNADFYSNQTDNLLNITAISPVFGYSGYINNSGELTNMGFEFGANLRVINTKNIKWDIGGNIASYNNEITSLPGGQNIIDIAMVDATVINKEGSPIGLFYGYKTDGIFNTQAEADAAGLGYEDYQGFRQPFTAGDVKFIDKNGDKLINEADRQVIGDPNPDFTGMFYTTVSYKNLALSAVFTYSQGNELYNALRRQTESMSSYANQSTAVANRWQVEGQQTDVPRAQYGDPAGNSRFSDRWIEDGSYMRLKTLSLSYSPDILSKYTKDITFYINANNLFTMTNYLGYDPEVSMSGASYQQGIDAGFTPQFSSIFLGVKIGL